MPRLAVSVLTMLLITQILLPLSAGRTEVGSDSKLHPADAAKRDGLSAILNGAQATVPALADPDRPQNWKIAWSSFRKSREKASDSFSVRSSCPRSSRLQDNRSHWTIGRYGSESNTSFINFSKTRARAYLGETDRPLFCAG